ncbi:hypothetical protein [Clostridium sp. DL1XJH146]
MGCGKEQTTKIVSDNTVQQDSVVNSEEFIVFMKKSQKKSRNLWANSLQVLNKI